MMRNKWFKLCTGAGVMAAAMLTQAQTSGNPPVSDTSGTTATTTTTTTHTGHSKQFYKSKDLIGADVKDAQDKKVGDITELYFNPQSGSTLAVIDIDGPRDAVVPLQGLMITRASGALRNAEVTLKSGQTDLKAGPTLGSNEWEKLDDATFTKQIYSYYHVQEPSAMGGSELEGSSGTLKDHSDLKR